MKRVSDNIDVLLTRFLSEKKATHADIIAQIRGTPRQQFRQVCATVACVRQDLDVQGSILWLLKLVSCTRTCVCLLAVCVADQRGRGAVEESDRTKQYSCHGRSAVESQRRAAQLQRRASRPLGACV